MFSKSMIEFLHSGCALLVGTVDETHRPHAGRGHGLTVLDPESGRVRLLVDADDEVTVTNLHPGAAVAITTANVRTLHSVQLKGRVVQVEPATEADDAKRLQYTSDFITDIHETDGDELDILRRWSDCRILACVVDIDCGFDQTPGPAAGTQMSGERA
ncbi:MAG TPA: hypothetical protein VLD86_17610 [Ilumatobacteraceae bacterium]|nr:hypothetical protein [Ilumatobacteraceae bacterium]